MIQISNQIWIDLKAGIPKGESLVARSIIFDVAPRLLCALDAKLQRHILIQLRPGEAGIEDTKSRGIGVSTKELQVQGQPSGTFIDIICLDVEGHPAFDLIGNEIGVEIENSETAPSEIIRRILGRWRQFWGQIPRQLLSMEELFGLFGELWFLSRWLNPNVGSEEGLKRWRGPFGARHDFEWKGHSIEVKASASTRGRIHHIHGLEQLEPPENGDLDLYSIRLREEGGAENTLPGLIEECSNQVSSDEESSVRFETALMQIGYSPIHNDEYAKIRIRVVDEALYSVKDNFPRLIRTSFLESVPSGVERIEYEINLNGYDNLIRARSASEFILS